MRVLKRDGGTEPVSFDKITERLESLSDALPGVDTTRVAAAVCSSVHDMISTKQLDALTANVAYALATEHPDYDGLATRILVSDLQKSTSANLAETYAKMAHLLKPEFTEAVTKNAEVYQAAVDYGRDFEFDYFGFKTMEKMYLTRVDGVVVERPQHMFMRVAIALWGDVDPAKVLQTYDYLSTKKFIHASPTLFNAGFKYQNLASCYLLGVGDSVDGIFGALTKCAKISKHGGGIGMHVTDVRGKGAEIKGTNGVSDGLVPMLRVANGVASYINQGGRRKGSIAVYIEPHHPDILAVLDLKKNSGDEHLRARDLFYAVWVSDLFMERVESGGDWSLFDPTTAPGLSDVHGNAYSDLYTLYESSGLATKTLKAQDVWFAILRSQIETGTPYILYKDAVNAKTNQANLGTIKSSNLCTEIMEYTSDKEVAVCVLGSLSLPAFVDVSRKHFDFAALRAATDALARNLDRVIDVMEYPVPEAAYSSKTHRPIGIGVQGLQDVFFALQLPFECEGARELNKLIFEHIYYAAISASVDLAWTSGPYATFEGSPASQGKLQYHLWGVTPASTGELPWKSLEAAVATYGLRNSLSIAPMPTATTSQLLGNVESFEAVTSNLYSRRTLAGEFVVLNKWLARDLLARGLWTPSLKNAIIAADGSVSGIAGIPEDVKAVYKTVWEISQKTVIDMAADRGAYVCQSQSMNLYIADPSFKKLSSMHFYGWKRGLKTGVYYLRSKPASRATQVTISAQECIACSG